MRIEITAYHEKDVDGFEGYICSSRDGVVDLEEMAQMITDFVRGAGFSYVVNVGFEKDDGSVTFGYF